MQIYLENILKLWHLRNFKSFYHISYLQNFRYIKRNGRERSTKESDFLNINICTEFTFLIFSEGMKSIFCKVIFCYVTAKKMVFFFYLAHKIKYFFIKYQICNRWFLLVNYPFMCGCNIQTKKSQHYIQKIKYFII